MPPSNIATAADYADAMMIARRAKNALFFLLLLMLLLQVGTFFAARMTNNVLPAPAETSLASSVSAATTAPTTQTVVADAGTRSTLMGQALRYLTALIDFLGILLIIVLARDVSAGAGSTLFVIRAAKNVPTCRSSMRSSRKKSAFFARRAIIIASA